MTETLTSTEITRLRETTPEQLEQVEEAFELGIGVIDTLLTDEQIAFLTGELYKFNEFADSVGLPILLEGSPLIEQMQEPAVLDGPAAELVRSIEHRFSELLLEGQGLNLDYARDGEVVPELLYYAPDSTGLAWHTDNLTFPEDLPTDFRDLAVMHSILTLDGEAEYRYKDPETGYVYEQIVKPGTLLISRSGDNSYGSQIEHMVTGPNRLSEDGSNLSDRGRMALIIESGFSTDMFAN